MGNAITLGSQTTTGGAVIKGEASVKINSQAIALVGDKASCNCPIPTCKKVGDIVALVPRAVKVKGKMVACAGDLVDTGCGTCMLLPSPHQVVFGTSMASKVNIGEGVSFGHGININLGGGGGGAAGGAGGGDSASGGDTASLGAKASAVEPSTSFVETQSVTISKIEDLKPAEIMEEINEIIKHSSTRMSESNFYGLEGEELKEIKKEWEAKVMEINTIRKLYYPNDMKRYFEMIKKHQVGNCMECSLLTSHYLINKYNFTGKVEVLKLSGEGDHAFVRVTDHLKGTMIIDSWRHQYYKEKHIKSFLFNPRNNKVSVYKTDKKLRELLHGLPSII